MIINFDNNKMIAVVTLSKGYYNIVNQRERGNSQLIKLFGYYHLKNTIQNLQSDESNLIKKFTCVSFLMQKIHSLCVKNTYLVIFKSVSGCERILFHCFKYRFLEILIVFH